MEKKEKKKKRLGVQFIKHMAWYWASEKTQWRKTDTPSFKQKVSTLTAQHNPLGSF